MAVYFRILKICLILSCLVNYCHADIRDSIESVLMPLNGITERTGNNDGKEVEMVLATCGLKKGLPYCAATINYAFQKVGVKTGVSGPAGAANWFANTDKITYKKSWRKTDYKSKKAQVFGLYFPDKGRVAHVGFIFYESENYYITFEGNTSPSGAVEGDQLTAEDREAGKNGGFYKKKRPKSQIFIIADYLTGYDNEGKDWRKNAAYAK